MKKLIPLLLSALLLCSCAGGGKTPAVCDINSVLHTDNRLIISPEGEQVLIKGMALGNEVWGNPELPSETHHTEDVYRELSELGFNSVRFYLNYALFEDDNNPYVYKESGFDWIDKNIKWAKKYNIGIILNMHYPQGGYQSQGNGDDLWNDVENQNRLSALWCEIATRYAGEPTIWGYGLINEPIVTWQGDKESSINHFKNIMQRLVNDMRQVTNQALFIERVLGIDYGDTIDWSLSVEDTFCLLEGENLIYEYHFYEPHNFTHQDMDWSNTLGQTRTYPDDTALEGIVYSDDWVDCLTSKKGEADGDWYYHEASKLYTGKEKYNVGTLTINARGVGADGAAYFDDIKVTEIDPDGNERVISSYDFSKDITGSIYPWSSNGTGKLSYSIDGHTAEGSVKVSGATGDYTVTCGGRFLLKEGYTYKVSGYIKYDNTNKSAIRIDYAQAESYMTFDKDFLESKLMDYISFSEKNNVALYMGEFGACANSFLYGRGGDLWVADMLELCRKHDISYNYHTYHEGAFGLYMSNASELPSPEDLNQELYDCFAENHKK